MPGSLGIITGTGFPGSGHTVYGLVQGAAGANVTQASISSIAWSVTRIADDSEETETESGSLTIASVVFDTPQDSDDDPRIPSGQTANFIATINATAFPVAGRGLRHRITITFTPATGQPFAQDWVVTLL